MTGLKVSLRTPQRRPLQPPPAADDWTCFETAAAAAWRQQQQQEQQEQQAASMSSDERWPSCFVAVHTLLPALLALHCHSAHCLPAFVSPAVL